MQAVRFGALEIMVTDRFTRRWDDRGSKATMHGAFFNPEQASPDWKCLGSLGHAGNHEDISGRRATILVRGVNAADQMVKPPVRFERIWRDQGSGANVNGAVWRPIPPSGYVALGDVWGSWNSWEPPAAEWFGCIRREFAGRSYVREGSVGDLIWWDKKSGADADLSTWQIVPPSYPADSGERLVLGADLHVAANGYGKPSGPVYVLDLPAAVVKSNPPSVPALTSHSMPEPRETDKVVDRAVTVPCTVVGDPGKTLQWQVANSPFYTLERRSSFYCQMHYDNSQGDSEQAPSDSVTTGISTERSEEFSTRTSVTVTASAGIELKGLTASVETSVTTELGYSSRYGVTQFTERTQTWPMTTPPRHSAALWSPRHEIRAVRKDGTVVGGQGGLVFDVDSRVYTQHPAANLATPLSEAIIGGDPDPFGETGPDPVKDPVPVG
ncbi:Vps62-related protein [Streptomyces sp. NPDC002490]|uniref:Vps62-related protein n=1 Tax=Streptomyces sp. NPDC002490 TaxID=3154416 RepID=UPI0033267689